MKADLFGPVHRKAPLVRMQAVDHGEAPGLMPGWRTAQGAHFQCRRCGHDAGWLFDMTVTEIRRGEPCPKCNVAVVEPTQNTEQGGNGESGGTGHDA